jgi:hypothetical protein
LPYPRGNSDNGKNRMKYRKYEISMFQLSTESMLRVEKNSDSFFKTDVQNLDHTRGNCG